MERKIVGGVKAQSPQKEIDLKRVSFGDEKRFRSKTKTRLIGEAGCVYPATPVKEVS